MPGPGPMPQRSGRWMTVRVMYLPTMCAVCRGALNDSGFGKTEGWVLIFRHPVIVVLVEYLVSLSRPSKLGETQFNALSDACVRILYTMIIRLCWTSLLGWSENWESSNKIKTKESHDLQRWKSIKFSIFSSFYVGVVHLTWFVLVSGLTSKWGATLCPY